MNLRGSSVGQALGLLPWRFTRSLTLGPVGLVEVRVSWPGHPRLSKKKKVLWLYEWDKFFMAFISFKNEKKLSHYKMN